MVSFVQTVDLAALPPERAPNLHASAARLSMKLTTAARARFPNVTSIDVHYRHAGDQRLDLICGVHAIGHVPLEELETIASPIVDDLDGWMDYQKGGRAGARRETPPPVAGAGPAGATTEALPQPGLAATLEQLEQRIARLERLVGQVDRRVAAVEDQLKEVLEDLEEIEEWELRP